MLFNDIKIIIFFQKSASGWGTSIPELPAGGGSALRPPSVMHLSYTTLLNPTPNLDILSFGLGPLPLANPYLLPNQASASDFLFYEMSHKKLRL